MAAGSHFGFFPALRFRTVSHERLKVLSQNYAGNRNDHYAGSLLILGAMRISRWPPSQNLVLKIKSLICEKYYKSKMATIEKYKMSISR